MDPVQKPPGASLTALGYIVAIIGVIAAGLAWKEYDAPSWILNAGTAAEIGGPLLIAGAVLIGAGAIVHAIRDR